MQLIDYLILVGFLAFLIGVGSFFKKRAERDITSFFLTGRTLTWYVAGASMVATSFASDTPLWVTSLVRNHGIQAVWQFWAPVIGSALSVVLFSRLWRRVGVTTDLELIELRYSGRAAALLRGVTATQFTVLLAPLIMAWVVKAMSTISQEAIGIPEDYQVITTFSVIGAAVLICAMSGLYGVVYTDFIQLIVATLGTILLSILALQQVGGLSALNEALVSHQTWAGNDLSIVPTIGPGPGSLSFWNALGYFGLLWWIVAQSGGYQAQRLLASKDIGQASKAQLFYTIVYYGILAWPWIIVALCSIVLMPDLGGDSQDAVYPRMLVMLLPVGLRGLVVAALVAAFISTISTLFNWASSYFVIDIYKRFICKEAEDRHYVKIARISTIVIAILAGIISLYADSIQQLLETYYTIALAAKALALLRWFWWRQNAIGELAGVLMAWLVAILMLQGSFDSLSRELFGWDEDICLSSDYNLLGARIFFVAVIAMVVAIGTSCLTPATDLSQMQQFLKRAQPFHYGWKRVIAKLEEPYVAGEKLHEVIWQWLLVTLCAVSLILCIGALLLSSPLLGLGLFAVFGISIYYSIANFTDYSSAANNHI